MLCLCLKRDCFVPFIMFSKCTCANSLRRSKKVYHMEDTMTIFSNIWIEIALLVKSAELICKYEKDLSHMVQGPTFLSLTACYGLQVSESSEGPRRRIGISDARVEILRVMVQRSGAESRGTATGSVIFFVAFCLNSVNALVLQYAPLVNHSGFILIT